LVHPKMDLRMNLFPWGGSIRVVREHELHITPSSPPSQRGGNVCNFPVSLLNPSHHEGVGHGHSRDGRPRNRQVLVGVVMASGWPIASYVFEGNRQDRSTVKEVLADVRCRLRSSASSGSPIAEW
jgi:hypothetical protein